MTTTPPSSGTEAAGVWQRRRGPIAFVAVALFAFLMGAWLSGGPDTQPESASPVQEAAPTVWTCSMHPQIKLPEPGKCPICFMDLIPLETGGDEEGEPRQLRMSEAARQLAQIQTSVVQRGFAEAEVRMVGKIAYDETRVADITAWVPGRLDRLYADYTGVRVRKGDHLVYMYSPELVATQEELLAATAAVEALSESRSRVLLTTARATRDAAREKLRLLGLTADQISELERTRETSEHLTIYAPIGGVVVNKNAREGIYVTTGTPIYTIADLEHLWVLFEAYESDLPWLRYGQHIDFTSPSFPGERFEAIISFVDQVVDPQTRTVKVRAVVDNSDGRLKPDMFVRGRVRSRIDRLGHVLDLDLAGKWICPMHPEIVKSGRGTCDVCEMPLVPATDYGYAERIPDDPTAPLLIPATAPLLTGTRAIVYVELPGADGPLFEGREVELGPRAGDFYLVKSGVTEGEHVVTHGAFKIDAELQIQARPSMMSPAGAPASAHDHADKDDAPGAATAGEPAHHPGTPIPAAARTALTPVYEAYLTIQRALAADDAQAADHAYRQLQETLSGIDRELFGAALPSWITGSERLESAASAGATAADIEVGRKAFYDLSNAIIHVHGIFGHAGDTEFFLTHCPMARNNQGADWLQTERQISNPYYGARMLRCGTFKDTLPGVQSEGN